MIYNLTKGLNERSWNNKTLKTWEQYKAQYQIYHIDRDRLKDIQSQYLLKNFSLDNYSSENFKLISKELESLSGDKNISADQQHYIDIVEEKVKNNIEYNFQQFNQRFEGKEKGAAFLKELRVILNSYKKILRDYKFCAFNRSGIARRNDNSKTYSQLNFTEKNLYKIMLGYNALREWIKQNPRGASYAELVELRIENPKIAPYTLTTSNPEKSISLLRQLQGIGTALKGLELERLATEVIKKKIPLTDKNNQIMTVVNTGAVRYKPKANSWMSVDIKEDIAVFDLASNIKIKIIDSNTSQPKVVSIKDFLNSFNENKTITIASPEDYQELQKAMVTGFSAKSNMNQSQITLHSGLTGNAILNYNSKFNDNFYWSLYHMDQLKNIIKRSPSDNEGYDSYTDALLNYNMSRMISKIIGEKNNFFVLQNRIISTYEYMNYLIKEKNRIAHFSGKPHLGDKGMNIVI